ncbi:MAG TPA: S-adenosylmethionine decarboxylase [Sedimentisphaerales bacterium]|nr:S-adenosylmethionine decarboxylase [Sedimentisphaerales bacterium]
MNRTMAFQDNMRMPVGLIHIKDLDDKPVVSGVYGKEAIFDCYGCDVSKFNRKSLRVFFTELVRLLNMEKGDLHFWDDVGVPEAERQTRLETTGTSAVQFILTSNITVHCLDFLERVYVNVFSCKDFNEGEAKKFINDWFACASIRTHVVYRL